MVFPPLYPLRVHWLYNKYISNTEQKEAGCIGYSKYFYKEHSICLTANPKTANAAQKDMSAAVLTKKATAWMSARILSAVTRTALRS
jgi:hypothetical protein